MPTVMAGMVGIGRFSRECGGGRSIPMTAFWPALSPESCKSNINLNSNGYESELRERGWKKGRGEERDIAYNQRRKKDVKLFALHL